MASMIDKCVNSSSIYDYDWRACLEDFYDNLRKGNIQDLLYEDGSSEREMKRFLYVSLNQCFLKFLEAEDVMTWKESAKYRNIISEIGKYGKKRFGDKFDKFITVDGDEMCGLCKGLFKHECPEDMVRI